MGWSIENGAVVQTQATVPGGTPAGGFGTLWLRTSDGHLIRTDSGGVDNDVESGSGGGLSVTAVKTANYTASAGDLVRYNPSGGTFTITFPAVPSTDDQVGTKNVNSSTASITLAGNGNNVESPATYSVAASQTITGDGIALIYQYDGTNWIIT